MLETRSSWAVPRRHSSLPPALVALVAAVLAPAAAWAHADLHPGGGFVAGFLHPITGLDHVVAMVAVGLWGAVLGPPALWLLPLAFPPVMALGGLLALLGVPLPGVEVGIALSGLVMGLMVLFELRPPLWLAALLVASFAVFHGHAPRRRTARRRPSPALQPGLRDRHGVAAPGGNPAGGSAALAGWAGFGAAGGRRGGPSGPVVPGAGPRMSGLGPTPALWSPLGSLPLAHLVPTGLGPWGDGMARLVLQPLDLLLLVALMLLAVQNDRSWSDRLALVLPLSWLVGGLGGLLVGRELPLALPCASVVTAVGVLVTLGPALPLSERFLRGGTAALALLFGLVAGSSLAGHGGALQALLGETVAIAVVTALLLMALDPPHPRWLALGLRVVGSWIAASGLLMLGWLSRQPL